MGRRRFSVLALLLCGCAMESVAGPVRWTAREVHYCADDSLAADAEYAAATWSPLSVELVYYGTCEECPECSIQVVQRELAEHEAGFTAYDYYNDTHGLSSAEVMIAPPDGVHDRRSTVLHEFGHAVGLPHLADRAAVMFKDIDPYTEKRELSGADLEAVRALYSVRPAGHGR